MATRLTQESQRRLSDFLSIITEFKRLPIDLDFYLAKSEVPRSPEDFKTLLEDFGKTIAKKKIDSSHIATVVRAYNPKIIPLKQSSKEKAAQAFLDYANSLENALKCLEYHLEFGDFPPGMTSIRDCIGNLKGSEIVNKYIEIVGKFKHDISMYGHPRLPKTEEKEEGQEKPSQKQKREDFWKWKGQDIRVQLIHKIQTNPKLKDLLNADSVEEIRNTDVGDKEENIAIKDAFARMFELLEKVSQSKRYNDFLDEDIDVGIILGSIISTDESHGSDIKIAGRSRNPKVYFKFSKEHVSVTRDEEKHPIKETYSTPYSSIRNIPILSIAGKSEPNLEKIKQALASILVLRSRGKAIVRQRLWAKYWDVCSVGRYYKGHYHFLLWPKKFQKPKTYLRVEKWDFNHKDIGKPIGEGLEVGVDH